MARQRRANTTIRRTTAVALLFSALAAATTSQSAATFPAQTDAAGPQQLHIVLAVDESGSMDNFTADGETSRIDSAKEAAAIVAAMAFAPGTKVSVIGFAGQGATAAVDVDDGCLARTIATSADRVAVIDCVDRLAVRTDDTRLLTDHYAALTFALDLIEAEEGRGTVFLVSDGDLNLGSDSATEDRALLIADELLPRARANGVSIWGLGVADPIDDLKDFVAGAGGPNPGCETVDAATPRAVNATQPVEIVDAFLEAAAAAQCLRVERALPTADEDGTPSLRVEVPAFATQATIAIVDHQLSTLTATDPTGQRTQGQRFDTVGPVVVIPADIAGPWHVQSDNGHDAIVRLIWRGDLDLRVELVAAPIAGQPGRVQVWLRGPTGEPVPIDPNTVTATFTDSSGSTSLALGPTDAPNIIGAQLPEVTCPQTATLQVDINVLGLTETTESLDITCAEVVEAVPTLSLPEPPATINPNGCFAVSVVVNAEFALQPATYIASVIDDATSSAAIGADTPRPWAFEPGRQHRATLDVCLDDAPLGPSSVSIIMTPAGATQPLARLTIPFTVIGEPGPPIWPYIAAAALALALLIGALAWHRRRTRLAQLRRIGVRLTGGAVGTPSTHQFTAGDRQHLRVVRTGASFSLQLGRAQPSDIDVEVRLWVSRGVIPTRRGAHIRVGETEHRVAFGTPISVDHFDAGRDVTRLIVEQESTT